MSYVRRRNSDKVAKDIEGAIKILKALIEKIMVNSFIRS